jgi:hypothetical protein
LTVPNGWSVEREALNSIGVGPSEDDLMAIADAVREVARSHEETTSQNASIRSASNQGAQVGRRGHLRAVPS